jgi:kynurenine formamidase
MKPTMSDAELEDVLERVCNWGRWGAEDERGTLNYIDDAKRAAAARMVESGRTVSLSLPLDTAPAADNFTPVVHLMRQTGPDGKVDLFPHSADFFTIAPHGHVNTHLDALCHIFWRGKMYNGFDADEVTSHGAQRCAIDLLRGGIVGRGVLLDIPKVRGVQWLENDDGIVASDLDAAEREHRVQVGEGDILFVRTGRARRRRVKGAWNVREGCAGLEAACLQWLHERRVAVLGGDGHNDLAPSPYKVSMAPIHLGAIAMMGIHLIDNADLEELAEACQRAGRYHFMFVMAPLVLERGTASPVNPIAIF